MDPITVDTTASKNISLFVWYANKGKIKASETQVNNPNNLNMATN